MIYEWFWYKEFVELSLFFLLFSLRNSTFVVREKWNIKGNVPNREFFFIICIFNLTSDFIGF